MKVIVITVRRSRIRTVTISRGAAAPVSIYRAAAGRSITVEQT